MSKRIVVTGHTGYIGSVLTPLLADAGYDVIGLDTGYYEECTLVPRPAAAQRACASGADLPLADAAGRGMVPETVQVPWIQKDIRDVTAADLEGAEAVIHLAALSNDPIGNLNAAWTEEINFQASVRLAQAAKAAGVRRFLFSSSCIMYGMAEAETVDETSPLNPQTDYARSKVKAEQAISRLADATFSPTFLRNGTIYGCSPRMRFDTVLNNLVGAAVTTGRVVLHSDGTPWRPVAHVQDIGRAFIHVLQAPIERVHNQAFNNGEARMNHQIRELAETVVRLVPGCRLECLASPDADQRTYKTEFGKFARTFPEFRFTWTVEAGARELCDTLKAVGLTHDDFVDRRFTRLKWLRHLLDSGRLDQSLRWSQQGAERYAQSR